MSPAQKMFGRACRTFLPTQRTNLNPTYPTPSPRAVTDSKLRQARYYNRRTRSLAPLAVGQSIRMRLPEQRTWSPGVCVGTAGPRSYWVRVNDVTYRRNRRQLLATDDPLPVQSSSDTHRPDREHTIAEPVLTRAHPMNTSVHQSAPDELLSDLPPVSCQSPPSPIRAQHAPLTPTAQPPIHSRPQRNRHPPAYLSDYVR